MNWYCIFAESIFGAAKASPFGAPVSSGPFGGGGSQSTGFGQTPAASASSPFGQAKQSSSTGSAFGAKPSFGAKPGKKHFTPNSEEYSWLAYCEPPQISNQIFLCFGSYEHSTSCHLPLWTLLGLFLN